MLGEDKPSIENHFKMEEFPVTAITCVFLELILRPQMSGKRLALARCGCNPGMPGCRYYCGSINGWYHIITSKKSAKSR
ncbi:hypothetical protein Trydic_g23761 [Trypoxylus dichotomus]